MCELTDLEVTCSLLFISLVRIFQESGYLENDSSIRQKSPLSVQLELSCNGNSCDVVIFVCKYV